MKRIAVKRYKFQRSILNRSGYLRLHCVEGYVARHFDPPSKQACLPLFDTRGRGNPANDSKRLENRRTDIPLKALATWANPAVYGS